MELNQLKYALQVAKHLHFSRAADELGITQPSLSLQIAKLEHELGVPLFRRKTRTVELTDAGAEFVAQAAGILSACDALRDNLRRKAASNAEIVRIGTFIPRLGKHGMADLLHDFHKAYPLIRVQVTEKLGSRELLKLLNADRIDAAFMVPTLEIESEAAIEHTVLLAGHAMVLLPRSHPLAGGDEVKLTELEQEACIAMTKTFSISEVILAACRVEGVRLQQISTCSHIESMIEMVERGFGISFLSSQFADFPPNSGVVAILLKPRVARNLSLVWLRKKAPRAALLHFRDFVAARLKEG